MKILTRTLNRFSVFFALTLAAPAMTASAGFKSPQYRSQAIEVIDIHQHVGDAKTMGPLGKNFVLSNLPNWIPMGIKNWSLETYANLVLQPYTPVFGTRPSCYNAGLSMCGLMAVYAPLTWGTYDNDAIIGILDDLRNRGPNGELSYFFGMASLNIHRFPDAAEEELANLRAALRHKLMKGIKLAFVHNELPLDDTQFESIYQVAREFGVPV